MRYFENDNDDMIMKEDKILNNSFSRGEQEYEAFLSPMRVDDSISHLYDDQLSDNLVEHRTSKLLDEEMYVLFNESPYLEKYKDMKRVDKCDMFNMFYYFKSQLTKSNTYSGMQIFIGFAEFFQINYDQLYSEIGVLEKEGILRELSEKGKVNDRIKTRKLF